jgi:zinc finger protein CreA/MIG
MPRAESKHAGNQFYSQFNSSHSQYLPEPGSPSPQPSLSSTHQSSNSSSSASKKKHVCQTCDRAFTTSGHLARHSRVHTGERNHKCPFPGCETRCSRQDNLQQHYRIHLSPGSRRTSSRSAMARQMNNTAPTKRGSTASSPTEPPTSPPPLSSPPPLEQARVYNHHSTPPDSPPPLAHATLPATAHLPANGSSRSSSSPETPYSPVNANLVPMPSQSIGTNGHNSQPYSYRSGTTTYQEQSQGAGFTYVHTTPVSHSSTSSSPSFSSSYSGAHNSFNNLPHINTSSPVLHSHHLQESPLPTPNHSTSVTNHSNRHSISHISPQPYPPNPSSSTGPPSPASSHSVSSHPSGPPTPSYVYHDDAHAYHHSNGIMADPPSLTNGHISSHGQLYSPTMTVQNHHRFDSPPPTLAPIQDERYIRRGDRHSGSHSHSYLHHPQPISNDYQYHHHSIGLGHGGWKPESGLRKGALVQ